MATDPHDYADLLEVVARGVVCGLISQKNFFPLGRSDRNAKKLMKKQLITTIDHIVFGTYSLDEGVGFIYQKLGVMPHQGGKHPLMGTQCTAETRPFYLS